MALSRPHGYLCVCSATFSVSQEKVPDQTTKQMKILKIWKKQGPGWFTPEMERESRNVITEIREEEVHNQVWQWKQL